MQPTRPPRANPFVKFFVRILLKISGWRFEEGDICKYPSSVLIGAFHTTNWDGLFAMLIPAAADVRIKFMIKQEWLNKPVFGAIIKWFGGIGIDRSKSNNMVDQIAEAFRDDPQLVLGITPEGTRKRTEYWKTGFYYIALKANVPIGTAFVDYKNKVCGFGPSIMPTGDLEKDMQVFRDFFATVTPKYPQNAGPIQFKPQVETEKRG